MNNIISCYELGKQAFLAGKPRAPMKDNACLQILQNKKSAEYHPTSLTTDLSESQKRRVEEKMLEWKRGWDEERAKT